MKNMKRFASLLMAMVMVFALAATASAAGNGKIIIKGIEADTQYNAYRILDLAWTAGVDGVEGSKDDVHRYTASTKWAAFVNSAAVKDVYLEIDALGTVTWKAGADAKSFAALAEKYAKDNGIAADATQYSPISVSDGDVVTFEGLDLGYYLVDSSMGALCSLDSTNPTAEINEKNDPTTIEKKVWDDKLVEWADSNTAEIGETVEYKATFVKQAGAHNYVIHDKMDEHLVLNEDSFKVYRNDDGSKADVKQVDLNAYTVDTNPTDGHTFDITFTNTYISNLSDGDVIDIYYSAVVSSTVTVGTTGHLNEICLQFGDSNTTEWDEVRTYTFGLDVWKHDGRDDAPLAGVEFQLYRTKNVDAVTGTVTYDDIVMVHANGVDSNKKNVYFVCNDATHATAIDTVVTGEGGEFIIRGLDETTYYLVETKPLPGYNPLEDAVEVKITRDEIETTGEYAGYVDHNIANYTGVLLPDTGGMGTTIFYVLGSILTLGAFVLFITKRRMITEK